MSILETVCVGRQSKPPRILVYGTEGVGKSTFAASTPDPIFIQTEDGLDSIDCASFPLATDLQTVMAQLTELEKTKHAYQTVVIDSLDWLERLIWDAVCHDYHTTSIEKADGGFQRGYMHAVSYWRRILDSLQRLREQKAMMIALIAHSKIEKFEDPDTAPYDRYAPRLHRHACALITEWCDAVLFATRKIRIQTENTGFGRERTTASAVGDERVLRCVGAPSCIAKNRYGLNAELPLSWSAVYEALVNRTVKKETE